MFIFTLNGRPLTRQELIGASLPRKIALARELYTSLDPESLAGSDLSLSRAELAARRATLQATMADLGLPAHCAHCGTERLPGGCCSTAIAEEGDAILFLVNLLAGCTLPTDWTDEEFHCPFLTPRGCCLAYKPFFCLNYLCDTLKASLTSTDRDTLDRHTGLVLQAQYAIETQLTALLQELELLRHE